VQPLIVRSAFRSCCSSLSLLSRARFCSSVLPCATLVDGCTCSPVVRATFSLIRPPIFSVFLVVLASSTTRPGLPEERRQPRSYARIRLAYLGAIRTLVHTYEYTPSAIPPPHNPCRISHESAPSFHPLLDVLRCERVIDAVTYLSHLDRCSLLDFSSRLLGPAHQAHRVVSSPTTRMAARVPPSLAAASLVLAAIVFLASVSLVFAVKITSTRYTAKYAQSSIVPPTTNATSTINGIAFSSINTIFFADATNNFIFVSSFDGTTTAPRAFAGTGAAASSPAGGSAVSTSINKPQGGVVFGGSLYFVENGGHCARSINLATTIVSTVAGQCGSSGYGGDGGSPLVALLHSPTAIAVDSSGRVFIADSGNKRIRMVSANGAVITTLVDFTVEGLSVIDLSFDFQSSYLYWVSSNILGRVNLAGQVTQVILRPGGPTFQGVSAVPGYAHLVSVIDSTNTASLIDCLNVALATTLTEQVGTTSPSNALSVAAIPGAILIGQSNGKFERFYNLLPIDALTFSIFGADTIAVDFQAYTGTSPHSIIPKAFNAQNATCGFGINAPPSTLSCPANVGAPRGMSITQSTPASNTVYYANNAGHTIEQLNLGATSSTIVFGTRGMSGTGTSLLNSPTSTAIDDTDSTVFVADDGNQRFLWFATASGHAYQSSQAYSSTTWTIRDIAFENRPNLSGGSRLWFVGIDNALAQKTAFVGYLDLSAMTPAYIIVVSTSPPTQTSLSSGPLTSLVISDPVAISVVSTSHTSTVLVVDSRLGVIRIDLTEGVGESLSGQFQVMMGLPTATFGVVQVSQSQSIFTDISSHSLGVFVSEYNSNKVIVLPAILKPGVSEIRQLELHPNPQPVATASAVDGNGNMYMVDLNNARFYMLPNRELPEVRLDTPGQLRLPRSVIAIGPTRNNVYVLEYSNNCIYQVIGNGLVVVAGKCGTRSTGASDRGDNGPPALARFNSPFFLERVGGAGNENKMLVGDNAGQLIRLIDWSVPTISTLISAPSNNNFYGMTYNPTNGLYVETKIPTFSKSPQEFYLINAANATSQSLYSTATFGNIDQFSPPPNLNLNQYTKFSELRAIEWESGDTYRFIDGSLIMRVTFNSANYFDASTAHMTTLAGTASSPYGLLPNILDAKYASTNNILHNNWAQHSYLTVSVT